MRWRISIAALLPGIAAWLLLLPVPVEPVAWDAPTDRGYVDPFTINDRLSAATGIPLGDGRHGPEDATRGLDGTLYVSIETGEILALRGPTVEVFAKPGGRPLGIETAADGSLLLANAYDGLQRIDHGGRVTTLVDSIDGEPLNYANSLAVADDGTVYFTNASSKFGARDFGGSYAASLLDILEHGAHGKVYAYDPQTRETREVMTGLNYANGIAVSAGGDFLLVAETGSYRILKYWLRGPEAGSTEVLLDNLPGFPDNIKNGLQGRFWIGFAAPRNALLDRLSNRPLARKILQRLPRALRPAATPSSHVIAINGDGEVLMNLHDPAARFPTLTGVIETRDSLYLTTLFGDALPVLAKRDLAR